MQQYKHGPFKQIHCLYYHVNFLFLSLLCVRLCNTIGSLYDCVCVSVRVPQSKKQITPTSSFALSSRLHVWGGQVNACAENCKQLPCSSSIVNASLLTTQQPSAIAQYHKTSCLLIPHDAPRADAHALAITHLPRQQWQRLSERCQSRHSRM